MVYGYVYEFEYFGCWGGGIGGLGGGIICMFVRGNL